MSTCVGPATFFAFAGFFLLALALMRVGAGGNDPRPGAPPAQARTVIPIVRAQTQPYDWEREGI